MWREVHVCFERFSGLSLRLIHCSQPQYQDGLGLAIPRRAPARSCGGLHEVVTLPLVFEFQPSVGRLSGQPFGRIAKRAVMTCQTQTRAALGRSSRLCAGWLRPNAREQAATHRFGAEPRHGVDPTE